MSLFINFSFVCEVVETIMGMVNKDGNKIS